MSAMTSRSLVLRVTSLRLHLKGYPGSDFRYRVLRSKDHHHVLRHLLLAPMHAPMRLRAETLDIV